MRRALLLLLLFSPVAYGQPSDPLATALERARNESKPLFVARLNQPACGSACKDFIALSGHPALTRRLRDFVFVVIEEAPAELAGRSAVELYAPSGELASRWIGVPEMRPFLQIVSLVEGARKHLVAASNRPGSDDAVREWALARLALGDLERGTELLQQLQRSSEEENRQLATIWLGKLDRDPPDLTALESLARKGASSRVRFEASLALAGRLSAAGQQQRRLEILRSAIEAAEPRSHERLVLSRALQVAEDDVRGIIGLGPAGSIVGGRRTIQPRITAKGVASVQYRLDGKLVATSRKAPFTASIDLGRAPARHLLEVNARGSSGAVLQQWSAVVNERSDAFAVRITEPRQSEVAGEIRVSAVAQVPRGRSIERLSIEWNGREVAHTSLATLERRISVGEGEQGILRAVVRLDDESEVEDVRLLNAGSVETAAVHLAELPVFLDGDSPLEIREEGERRRLEKLVRAEDAPLLVGILLDTSSSMLEHLLDVQEAAIRFLETTLTPRDRAFVVGFETQARLVASPTADTSKLEAAILSLQARGATALHDGLITAYLQFHSTGVRRALIVFSDGLDSSSTFSDRAVFEVARRSGVPTYVLTLTPKELIAPVAPRGRDIVLLPSQQELIQRARKELRQVSHETGGKPFDMRSVSALPEIYAEIAADLQRQSLAIFKPSSSSSEWRRIEVRAKGKKVRSPAGIFVSAEVSP
jgi:VWFA-related protein